MVEETVEVGLVAVAAVKEVVVMEAEMEEVVMVED